jgi:hypothetical protein
MVMESKMTIEEAAQDLESALRPFSWYLSTGVGATESGPALFVYVKSNSKHVAAAVAGEWQGYRVVVRTVGGVRPLTSPASNGATGRHHYAN